VSIPTLAARPLGDDTPLDRHAYAAGITDAHDEHRDGAPLTVLETRAAHIVHRLHEANDSYTAYALGYAGAVVSLRSHQQATTTAQTAVIFKDQENHR
jgi:hypothetical protein